MNTIEIIEAFEQLIAQLKILCSHLYDELTNYPTWIDNGEEQLIDDRDRLIYTITHFKFITGLSSPETFNCIGAVGVAPITLDYIQAVNQAKTNFRDLVHAYMRTHQIKDIAMIRQLLASAGYLRVKLKQVFRQLIMIPTHPRRIAFTKASNGSNKVITLEMAKERLLKLGEGMHIDIQLAKLNLLKPDEKLVIYRQIKSHWATNVSTFKNEQNRSQTKCIYTSLPIFYLHNFNLPEPIVVFSKKINRSLAPRADKQIEEQPFLPSLSAYRYKR